MDVSGKVMVVSRLNQKWWGQSKADRVNRRGEGWRAARGEGEVNGTGGLKSVGEAVWMACGLKAAFLAAESINSFSVRRTCQLVRALLQQRWKGETQSKDLSINSVSFIHWPYSEVECTPFIGKILMCQIHWYSLNQIYDATLCWRNPSLYPCKVSWADLCDWASAPLCSHAWITFLRSIHRRRLQQN